VSEFKSFPFRTIARSVNNCVNLQDVKKVRSARYT